MATHTGTTPIPPGLRLTHDLNDALTTWSTSQRTVIGLAADFADSGEWMATSAASAAHWIAAVADIEVCTAREWIRVGRRLRHLPVIADLFDADELSYSKVRTLSRIATPENEQQLAAIAADVAGTKVILFARLRADDRAFWCLGPATYVSHEGERPIAITWRLDHRLPADLFTQFAAAAVA
jgi:hypothetical protein